MNELAKQIRKIEFWIATMIYLSFVFVLLSEGTETETDYPVVEQIVYYPSSLVRELVQATTLYGAFIFLTLYVVPNFDRRRALGLNLLWTTAITLVVGIVFGGWTIGIGPLAVFAGYSALKYGLVFLWYKGPGIRARFPYLAPGVLLGLVLWVISIILFRIGDADSTILAVWVTMIPFGILFYSWSFFKLIPDSLKKDRALLTYLGRVIGLLFLSSFPVVVICMLITNDSEVSLSIVLTNNLFQLFVTTPFSWIFYKHRKRETDEIDSLQKELGHSAASLDFLRSQINPHFLFNALNTLYGTAIQEKAERTSQGIQKLGDMMRFMLHENVQPKIMLNREIEYLQNYISLQRLRTDALPGVSIDTTIDQDITAGQIAPMLLIPFVENAFKHGISLRESSYIIIRLSLDGNTLHFKVSNSRHVRAGSDPEKDKGGIGLQNVRERLRFAYPGKHELHIHETEKDFFVQLTIQLS